MMKRKNLYFVLSLFFMCAFGLFAQVTPKWQYVNLFEIGGNYKARLCGDFGNKKDVPVIFYLNKKGELWCCYPNTETKSWSNPKKIKVWSPGEDESCLDFSCAVDQQGEPCVAYVVKEKKIILPNDYCLYYQKIGLDGSLGTKESIAEYSAYGKSLSSSIALAFYKKDYWVPCVIYGVNNSTPGEQVDRVKFAYKEKGLDWIIGRVKYGEGKDFSLKYNPISKILMASYVLNSSKIYFSKLESNNTWSSTIIANGSKSSLAINGDDRKIFIGYKNGNLYNYVSSSDDGINWSDPTKISSTAAGDCKNIYSLVLPTDSTIAPTMDIGIDAKVLDGIIYGACVKNGYLCFGRKIAWQLRI